MHFGLSEEQILLQDTVRRYLDDKLSLDTLRGQLNQTCDESLWQGIAELGATGVLIPEEYGGIGLTMMEAQVIAEAMGRAIAPAPFLGTAIIAPLAIGLSGNANQKEQYLPGIASGAVRYGCGLSECVVVRDDPGLHLQGDRISGKSYFVMDTRDATSYLLAPGGDSLVVAAGDAAGLSVEHLTDVDKTRSFGVLTCKDVEVDVLGKPNAAKAAIGQALAAARLALASDSFGAAEVMFDRAREYSLERYQFERPIGTFQGLKHQLAQMVTELEPCRSLLWYTAHAFEAFPEDFEVHACHAKALVADVAKYIARTSIEIHGGMGFTELLGLHLWFKRIETNRQLLGGPEITRHQAAVLQQWAAPLSATG